MLIYMNEISDGFCEKKISCQSKLCETFGLLKANHEKILIKMTIA